MIRLMNAVFEMDLDPKWKIVLLVLADHADVNAYCFPGQETLARRTSIPERSLRRILQALEEDGLIRRERRTRAGGQRTSDGYDLTAIVAGKPTGQNEGGNRPTVAATGEPSGEPSVTDLTKTSTSQSRLISANDRTDSKLSPVMMGVSRRRGLSEMDLWQIRGAIKSRADRTLSLADTLTVSLHVLDKAKAQPQAPMRYIAAAINSTPLEIQKFIDETGLGS